VKRVALVGSSGGNLHRSGGTEPAELLGCVREQLLLAGIELADVVFVAADTPLDAGGASRAALWRDHAGPERSGSLDAINDAAREADSALASAIAAGDVDGLILVSADPVSVNRACVQAAVARDLPAVGSGGSCMAEASALGLRLIAASGTTGTTPLGRAVTYAAGLAREWNLAYQGRDDFTWRRLDPRPVLCDALPVAVAVGVLDGIARYWHAVPALGSVLPVAVAVLATRRVLSSGEAAVTAGLAAGVLGARAGVLGGLTAGFLAALLARFVLARAPGWNWPGTATEIMAGGLCGALPGWACGSILAGPGRAFQGWVESGVGHVAGLPTGVVLGALLWPALVRGLYHSLILPLIVLEIAVTGESFLAVLDVVCLVTVAAGIAAGQWVRARDAAAVRTVRLTVVFGTYVEGVLPLVRRDRGTFLMTCGAAAAAGGVAGAVAGRSVPYLSPVVVPFVGHPVGGLVAAVIVAFLAGFAGSLGMSGAAGPKPFVA
jgi:hypothetical protein